MNQHYFNINGANLTALKSGALWWADQQVLTVSDLHLGKSERISRRGGPILPPYETQETLSRLEHDIESHSAKTVICLGDSFDDLLAAKHLSEDNSIWIKRLQAGRRWIWIEGNHDPGPISIGGTHLAELTIAGLTFRHIAKPGASSEVSGHYHPKHTLSTRGRAITCPCFIYDNSRLIMPAYGTYTGGLKSSDPALQNLFGPDARVVLTGKSAHVLPLRQKRQVQKS